MGPMASSPAWRRGPSWSTAPRATRPPRARSRPDLAERGIAFVDAPVSGGPPLAAKGASTVMCGGSAEDVARAEEVVAPFAGKVVHLGPGRVPGTP